MTPACSQPRRALLTREGLLYGVRFRCGGRTIKPRYRFLSFEDAARAARIWLDLGETPEDTAWVRAHLEGGAAHP